jgi:hypothetical protein
MDLLNQLQWPAMAVTIAAAWLVASSQPPRRNTGFWAFMLSNVLWIAWGWHAGAPALIALQIGLAAMNIRGAIKTEPAPGSRRHAQPVASKYSRSRHTPAGPGAMVPARPPMAVRRWNAVAAASAPPGAPL